MKDDPEEEKMAENNIKVENPEEAQAQAQSSSDEQIAFKKEE